MQLRQTNPADDIFTGMGGAPAPRDDGDAGGHPHHQDAPPREDPLGDVFGADEDAFPDGPRPLRTPPPGGGGGGGVGDAHHPSDIHRLRAEHTTAGYREGLAAAKAQSVQGGFDEGFSLGATLGARAGQLLGLLEGIAAALRGAGDPQPAREADRLLSGARAELSVVSVFSEAYWAPDGTWKYPAAGDEAGELLFSHVAESHPLLRRWAATVDAQAERWGIDRAVFEGGGGAAAGEPAPAAAVLPEAAPKAKAVHVQPPKDAMSW